MSNTRVSVSSEEHDREWGNGVGNYETFLYIVPKFYELWSKKRLK